MGYIFVVEFYANPCC